MVKIFAFDQYFKLSYIFISTRSSGCYHTLLIAPAVGLRPLQLNNFLNITLYDIVYFTSKLLSPHFWPLHGTFWLK